ncbi:MAG: flagella basal body P-ring formation protein FlgA [Calditrichaeota bacterium]|nr:MAG: flagella basal body P-ring formation protein FlgA [Calditrichota bacterium]
MKNNQNNRRPGRIFFFFVPFLFLCAAASLVAGEKINLTIKSNVIVVGPEIKLTEVCEFTPKDKSLARRLDKIILGRAAPPGESKEVSRSLIKMHLRRTGLYDRLGAISGPRSARVKTAHKDITRVKIEDAVASYISKELKNKKLEWRFEFLRIAEKIAGPVKAGELKVRLQNARLKKGHTTFDVRVLSSGKTVNRTKVTGTLRIFEDVAVAAKSLKRGDKIGAADMVLKQMETTYISGDLINTITANTAMECRVRIPAGKVLTRKMIAETPTIRKGETVELEILAGNVFLRTNALSQQNGRLHEKIRVWMQDTRKILKGEVVGKGKVRVEL